MYRIITKLQHNLTAAFNVPFRLHITIKQTVAMTMAITAHPTAIVIRIATRGTFESPELDHLDSKKLKIHRRLNNDLMSHVKIKVGKIVIIYLIIPHLL